MSRLKDADELLKRVGSEKIQAQIHGREFSTCFMSPGGTPSTEWWYVEDLIENAPTIEQPEIIRCKDCKEFRRWIDTDITFCAMTESEVKEQDFCSRAERREEGEE